MRIVLVFVVFQCTIVLYAQNSLPRDAQGWTVFQPSADTRLIYVSNSGNDAAAEYYAPDNVLIGADPFMPQGAIKPFQTIAAALDAARNDFPDWVLLKRGDVWEESLPVRNGRSATEPFVAASFGPGTEPPLLRTGASGGVNVCCKDHHFIAVTGISFYAHTRNPDSPEYTGPDGGTGFNFYTGEGFTGEGVLVEGCSFRFYTNNVVQGPGTIRDVVIRRNLILDDYSATAHSQGMYTNNASLLLEENIFDHNGWYMQQIDGGSEKENGQATMYNHNTYFANAHDVTFRGNMFLRASSIGNKWTANNGQASTVNIVMDNNLYVEGEIAMSIGGNQTDPPWRFRNVTVSNNVMLDIGRARPTNRSLGWYLEINDWDGGSVTGNLFLHAVSPDVGNVYAINLIGETRNVIIRENIIHDLRTGGRLISLEGGTTKEGVSLETNVIQSPAHDAALVRVTGSTAGYSFADNTYFSTRQADEWFSLDGAGMNIDGWRTGTGETGAVSSQLTFTDPSRTVETYNAALGGEADFEAFIAEVRKQSRLNWRPAYTAAAVNNWIREGFDMPQLNNKSPRSLTAGTDMMREDGKVFTLRGRYLGTYRQFVSNGSGEQGGIYLLYLPEKTTGAKIVRFGTGKKFFKEYYAK